MAHVDQRRDENQTGEFYVDRTCIDCDTCRWMAPETFDRLNCQSAVYHQPDSEVATTRALQALLSCPTASIGTVSPPKTIKAVQETFPILVTDNIYHCGYHAESSFGAASYLIVRPEGNVLVDSPRFSAPLAKRIEALGGVKWLYLTHRDDVADHQQWHDRFGCDRILHTDEVNAGTQSIEKKLIGSDPVELADNLLIITVPGHTQGHTVLLYQNKYLFSGDHLAYSKRQGHLVGFREACWYSWETQIESMKRLQAYDFEWVLPGHGRRLQATKTEMRSAMQQCVDWMQLGERSGEWD
jgi:glyoxylase-like metal-dependent hydrolase (beta-lactamase superfamily II)/ferredoxin